MASDVDWIARFRAESERIAQYDPEYAAALPTTLLLTEIDRLTAERDAALAALQAVREAQSLGEALAAVAKHDGLTTTQPTTKE